ncbi:unnamed protein product [Meloidogyne enterolobii]|uniref:Uncharacterized protein n=1 Tax=Meloidogyne enterolobii TaxID=390850 RepID=A0ACB0ZMR0_MELEN
MQNYEMAAINSIRTCFPLCEIRCCLFHLVRNMKKKLSEFGLMQRYRNDPVFATQSRWITSMAFLPIGDLTPAIIALDRNLMPELQPIMDWFVMNYTGTKFFMNNRLLIFFLACLIITKWTLDFL